MRNHAADTLAIAWDQLRAMRAVTKGTLTTDDARVLDSVIAMCERSLETCNHGIAREHPPVPVEGTDVTARVVLDLKLRSNVTGRSAYGRVLTTGDGRRSLVDLYQELLDACCYVKKEILEREEADAEARAQRAG